MRENNARPAGSAVPRLKIKAAAEGVTLKELLTGFVEKGLYGSPEPEKKPIRSPLPTPLTSARGTIPSLTNAEIDKIFLEEDMERRGMKRDR